MSDEKKKEKLRLIKNKDLTDPVVILDLLKDAILRKPTDKEEVAEALRRTFIKYEQQQRLFLVAAANAELPRIVKLMTFLESCEKELFGKLRLENATNRELIKMYALAQSHLTTSLDAVKKVADMRLEALKAIGGADGLEKMFSTMGEEDDPEGLNTLAGLPMLDAQQRDNVRKLISGLINSVSEDDSVEPIDELDTDTPED